MEQETKTENTSIAWGVASLVTGILSILIFFMPYFGLPLAIFAIVAHKKQNKIKPMGISMGGYVCGILGVIFNGITTFFILLALLFVGSMGGL